MKHSKPAITKQRRGKNLMLCMTNTLYINRINLSVNRSRQRYLQDLLHFDPKLAFV